MSQALVIFGDIWPKLVSTIFNNLVIGDGVSIGYLFIFEMVCGVIIANLAPIAQTRTYIHDIIRRHSNG